MISNFVVLAVYLDISIYIYVISSFVVLAVYFDISETCLILQHHSCTVIDVFSQLKLI